MEWSFPFICVLILVLNATVCLSDVHANENHSLSQHRDQTDSHNKPVKPNQVNNKQNVFPSPTDENLHQRFQNMLGHHTAMESTKLFSEPSSYAGHEKAKFQTASKLKEELHWQQRLRDLLDHHNKPKPTVATPALSSPGERVESRESLVTNDKWKKNLKNLLDRHTNIKSLEKRGNSDYLKLDANTMLTEKTEWLQRLQNLLNHDDDKSLTTKSVSTNPVTTTQQSPTAATNISQLIDFVKKNDFQLSNEDMLSFMSFFISSALSRQQTSTTMKSSISFDDKNANELKDNNAVWQQALQDFLNTHKPISTITPSYDANVIKSSKPTTTTASTTKTTKIPKVENDEKTTNVRNITQLLGLLDKSGIRLSDEELVSFIKYGLSSNKSPIVSSTTSSPVDFRNVETKFESGSGNKRSILEIAESGFVSTQKSSSNKPANHDAPNGKFLTELKSKLNHIVANNTKNGYQNSEIPKQLPTLPGLSSMQTAEEKSPPTRLSPRSIKNSTPSTINRKTSKVALTSEGGLFNEISNNNSNEIIDMLQKLIESSGMQSKEEKIASTTPQYKPNIDHKLGEMDAKKFVDAIDKVMNDNLLSTQSSSVKQGDNISEADTKVKAKVLAEFDDAQSVNVQKVTLSGRNGKSNTGLDDFNGLTADLKQSTEKISQADELWEDLMNEKVFVKPTPTQTMTQDSNLPQGTPTLPFHKSPFAEGLKSHKETEVEKKIENAENETTSLYLVIGFGIGAGLLLIVLVISFICVLCRKHKRCCWSKKDMHTTVLNPDANRWDPQLLRPSRENMNAFLYSIPVPLTEIRPIGSNPTGNMS